MKSRTAPLGPRLARRSAFTLLELCVVLLIMALLAGAAMPAMESAFTEQTLRGDAHQLSMMVKTAMIKSGEQQRPYLISLDGNELLLEPAPASVVDDDQASVAGATTSATFSAHDDADAGTAAGDVTMTQTLGNALKFPDAQKKNAWEALPSVRWTFQPSGLCPLPRVRLERGNAYIEMSFNALTGDVEDEASYIP
jgi:prepilin-type N-terminal cleavage/methylation domain-containing protein